MYDLCHHGHPNINGADVLVLSAFMAPILCPLHLQRSLRAHTSSYLRSFRSF